MQENQKWGVTETSDPAFHLDLFDNLYLGNTIITKRLSSKLIDKLVEHKDKCILHLTCTGMGGSVIEPLVPNLEETVVKFRELLSKGFPIGQVVLRIDPIIGTDKGFSNAVKVIEAFKEFGIKRVRFSVLDMYDHVKERFNEKGYRMPYETFHAPYELRMQINEKLIELGKKYGFEVECCGEPGIGSITCLSQKDVDILGLTDVIKLEGYKGQRKSCMCPSNKAELIKAKPKRCPNNCIYCYWKD